MRQNRPVRRRLLTAAAGAGLAVAMTAAIGGASAAAAPNQSSLAQAQWPTHCLDSVPTGPADYQEAFDFRRGGWAGADGAGPIPLPDGRILWLFGDSFMGTVNANNELLPGWRLVISVQVQNGRCFTPMTGGTVQNPSSFFPNLDNLLHWPAGGFVDTSVNPPVLRVVSDGVVPGTLGVPGAARVFTLSLPSLQLIGVNSLPYPIEVGSPAYGGGLFRDGNHVYLYRVAPAIVPSNPTPGQVNRPGLYVARAPANNFINGTFEYWTGSSWSQDVRQAGPAAVDFPRDPGGHTTPGTITRWGNGYLMTGKAAEPPGVWVWATPVYAWTAPTPTGPWTVVRNANGTPRDLAAAHPGFPQGRWIYGGLLVTNVPGASVQNPMLVFSTNALGCDPNGNPPVPCTRDNDVTRNVYLYGPHFLRPAGLPPRV